MEGVIANHRSLHGDDLGHLCWNNYKGQLGHCELNGTRIWSFKRHGCRLSCCRLVLPKMVDKLQLPKYGPRLVSLAWSWRPSLCSISVATMFGFFL